MALRTTFLYMQSAQTLLVALVTDQHKLVCHSEVV